MVEPEKPFACTIPDCGMTFTNEDHLHVHTKKHDMVLQLGLEQKAAFVADQTPTPTRFIRNCEEVGLFQDLQNVNPFDEGFKRAMETKHGLLSLESGGTSASSDDLHTPQMMFPIIDGDSALFTTNNQRNITISRSSSDESGAIKEFETTTISKLTNEVTTISRIVGKADDKLEEKKNDSLRKDSVSYTNNVIKIQSNLVRKDSVDKNPIQTLIYEDTVIKDSNIVTSDKPSEIPPIMSQKSLDFIVDSLNDFSGDDSVKNNKRSKKTDDDYEVIIKLPNGKQVRMRAVDEATEKVNAKELLKKTLTEKVEAQKSLSKVNILPTVSNVVPITAGTLIPVTLVGQTSNLVQKVPITPLKLGKVFDKKPVKRKSMTKNCSADVVKNEKSENHKTEKKSVSKDLDSKSAASRRYRARLKESWSRQALENKQLRETNEKLTAEKAVLKMIITEHMKRCNQADDLRNIMDRIKNTGTNI